MQLRVETIAEARGRAHLPALDGVRGLAILLVFLFHALGASLALDHLAWAGWHRAGPVPVSFFLLVPTYLGAGGVAMFFVVSGFCIHWSHQRSREKGWRVFFIRRFFRIYPPYLAALLIFAFCWPGTRLGFGSRHDVDQLIVHVLLLQNNLGPGFLYGVNPSFWSIGTEVQLYVLYPALLFFSAGFGWRRTLLGCAGVEVVLRTIWGGLDTWSTLGPWLSGDPLMYGCSWALGAKLAEDYLEGRPLPMDWFPLWAWPALAVGSYFMRPLFGFGFLLWALATAAVLSRILSGQKTLWRGFLENRILRGIGVVSYSVYLLHQPLVETVGSGMRALGVSGGWWVYGACVAAGPGVLLISWGFYRVVELPSIAAGKRVSAGKLRAKSLELGTEGG